MKKLVLISLLFLSACSDPKAATRTLQDNGYTDIKIGGYGLFRCSEKDSFSTTFKAKNLASGRQVEGVVCRGIFKGSTIRTY